MIVDGHVFLGKTIYMEHDTEALISNMDRLSVDASVVVTPPPGPFYDEGNDYVHAASGKYPKRLIPLYHVHPFIKDIEEKVDEALSKRGFKGLNLSPTHDGYGVGSPKMEAVVKVAQKHEAPIFVHSGDSIFCPPESVSEFASRFEDVNFVTSMSRRAPNAAQGKENLYLMSKSFPVSVFKRGNTLRLDVDRLIFVSEAPLGSLEVELKAVELADLSPDIKDKVMGGNLQRILKM